MAESGGRPARRLRGHRQLHHAAMRQPQGPVEFIADDVSTTSTTIVVAAQTRPAGCAGPGWTSGAGTHPHVPEAVQPASV